MSVAQQLAELLGQEAVLTEPRDLAIHSKDLSPSRLIQQRAGVEDAELPEAVVRPADTRDVSEVLRWADAEKVPVVPRGGGSNVVRGIAPSGGIVLDLGRMDDVLDIDERSRLVRIQAGARGGAVQRALESEGWMLGHQPQSIALSSVGGWIATRSAGQLSLGFGVIEDILAAMDVVIPGGRILRERPVPRRSAGPRLDQLFIGSEGALGVVTEAVLKIVPTLEERADAAFRFDHMADGVAACRAIAQAGPGGPILLRLYDADDTAIFWRRAEEPPSGHTLIMSGRTSADLERAVSLAREAGGETAPDWLVGSWWDHRNDAAEDLMTLLSGRGVLGPHPAIDTFEIAATWSHLRGVYHAMKEELGPDADILACHISHVYAGGACLYFTAVGICDDDEQAARRLEGWWDKAMSISLREGASISHHHGIGRTRAAWLRDELGDWFELLRAVKRAVDPNGIMNPGVFGI